MLGSAPLRAVTAADRAALWVGPGEWLVLAPADETELASSAMRSLGVGMAASIVEISDRNVAVEITGRYAAWCLNGFCALDLDPRGFPVGSVTRTVFGQAEIVLWRTDADSFHMEVARSFAPYVWTSLETARQALLTLPA
jgi:heterotetrameric sarcosine oxidase gamma subunit